MELLDKEVAEYAREILENVGINTGFNHDQEMIAYGFTDNKIVPDLKKLKQIYEGLLSEAST